MVHEGGRPQNEPGDDDRKQDPAQGIAGEVPTVVSQPVHESSAESSSGLVTGASLQERAPDLFAERIDADGLVQHDRGRRLEEVAVSWTIRIACHQQHGRPAWRELLDRPVDRGAVDIGHLQVADDQVVGLVAQMLERGLAAMHRLHRMAIPLEHSLNQLSQLGLIVDHENAGHVLSLVLALEAGQAIPARISCSMVLGLVRLVVGDRDDRELAVEVGLQGLTHVLESDPLPHHEQLEGSGANLRLTRPSRTRTASTLTLADSRSRRRSSRSWGSWARQNGNPSSGQAQQRPLYPELSTRAAQRRWGSVPAWAGHIDSPGLAHRPQGFIVVITGAGHSTAAARSARNRSDLEVIPWPRADDVVAFVPVPGEAR